MLKLNGILNRLFDVLLILIGAALAYQIRFSDSATSGTAAIGASTTAFSVALSLGVFHAFRV